MNKYATLEKVAVAPWMANLASKAQEAMSGWDPTLKSGIVGAGLGGLAGGLAGGLSNISGGYREPIDQDMAQQLLSAGIDPQIVMKMVNVEEAGELDPEEIQMLQSMGVDYDQVAPKAGYMSNMLSGISKGMLGGGALGGGLGVAAQELPRYFAGLAAPSVGANKAQSYLPDWSPDWAKNFGQRAGEAAGSTTWNMMSRPDQFAATEQALGKPLPSTLIDSTLNKFSKT